MRTRALILLIFMLTVCWVHAQEGAGILSTVDTTSIVLLVNQADSLEMDSIKRDSLGAEAVGAEAVGGEIPDAETALQPNAIPVTREEPRPLVRYSTSFEFRDGIYGNFDMVKANTPIKPARIHTDLDMYDRAFYEKITAEKSIVIYDRNGVMKEMKTKDIWGYARSGSLYINVGSAFHRISFVGSISHFVASITTYNPNYYDPYYYNPYSPYSNSYNRHDMNRSNYASTDLRQYLLDFESGEVMEYTTESLEVLLMKDPELADEFQTLKSRKKKQMKFVFIRRFNERNPLYFPAD